MELILNIMDDLWVICVLKHNIYMQHALFQLPLAADVLSGQETKIVRQSDTQI